jgi:hypothetical protein
LNNIFNHDSKGISGIAAIIGIIAILLIPQAMTPDSFAAIPHFGIDPNTVQIVTVYQTF